MYSTDDNDQDVDDFQDACDEELPADMTLEVAVKEAQQAINYFFNNKFHDAKALMDRWAKVSMYHALGQSVFLYMEAMLTFEPVHIQAASGSLKHALRVCNRYRRKGQGGLGGAVRNMVKRSAFEQYTPTEAHAELCHAECLLLKALLIFIEDETLSSFIKAGIKIRSCYHSYKDCKEILKQAKWKEDSTKVDFESGVKMGIGTFNLMISMLPGRVIKLLEFIGFSGNKQRGIEDLLAGYSMDGIRQILCVMTLLSYHLIVLYVLGHHEGDLKLCDEILKEQLAKYPNGVWFLFYRGRLEFMRGHFIEAEEWYLKCRDSQKQWTQFHHFCYWELLWLHCVKLEWVKAESYASKMLEGSKWSPTIYSYQKAAIMIMQLDGKEDEAKEKIICDLMKDLPKYKQRIAGKSLPMEKFCIRRSERFFYQKETLVLPMIELMYMWNMFKLLKNNFQRVDAVLKVIERALRNLTYSVPLNKYDNDNRAMLLLLKGACLRQMSSPLQALECLENAIALQKEVIEDSYIVPYAIVEIALLEWEQGNKEKALLALEDAKRNYTGYSLESRLHFRIHTAQSELKQELQED